MTSHMPLMVDIRDKQVIVIGGGKVAARRILVLARYTDNILVISPTLHRDLTEFVTNKKVTWCKRKYQKSDVTQADFVVIATDNSELNDEISREASSSALINVASDAEAGNVTFPSILQRHKLTISVSTNGASPLLTKEIKKELEEKYNEDYESYIDFLDQSRSIIKKLNIEGTEKQNLLKSLLSKEYLSITKQQAMLNELKRMM
ncbi:NAD(P)-binding protein [Staphylococcus sp. SQ8-PEA]|uniref:precorrin-2 dehydrogenase n=1 Tax=Staphylococcus marylandisciuri TaxID=2981529 RepID=A0ABT2QQM3_9STAP|nr:NAD(P)-binding protein [Staphylococcus marylandisciuri]MCU5746289.1 NAD(P)-binding protein [Staphylococcus marylandisciuri]